MTTKKVDPPKKDDAASSSSSSSPKSPPTTQKTSSPTLQSQQQQSLYVQGAVVICAILFGFVCGGVFNKMPVEELGPCVEKGEYCGTADLGQEIDCCNGDKCTNRDVQFHWKCGGI